MSALRSSFEKFARLLAEGKPLEAMERYYGDEIVVFENRELARAGKAACLAHERDLLARQPGPISFKVLKSALDEKSGCAFLEYVLRFTGPEGRPMRLEEVAVQRWSEGSISEERFYYEGIVDEGNESA
jgi:ketosteroid isomerase-like protein